MSADKEGIFIFGASGHAKVIIDTIEIQRKYYIEFLVDDDTELKGKNFFGYPVLGGKEDLLSHGIPPEKTIVAIGDNKARLAVADWLEKHNFDLATAVHPSAQLGREVVLGIGTVVMALAVINSSTTLGKNVIVNTGAKIDHDCFIADGVHIAPGATLCGSVRVGKGSFIGAGSTIIQNITIGEHVIIGAGSTVIKDIPDRCKVVGSRIITGND
jgi:sugar O-acyltransferase (sialic acid O-acetyltransferase NeuD family)